MPSPRPSGSDLAKTLRSHRRARRRRANRRVPNPCQVDTRSADPRLIGNASAHRPRQGRGDAVSVERLESSPVMRSCRALPFRSSFCWSLAGRGHPIIRDRTMTRRRRNPVHFPAPAARAAPQDRPTWSRSTWSRNQLTFGDAFRRSLRDSGVDRTAFLVTVLHLHPSSRGSRGPARSCGECSAETDSIRQVSDYWTRGSVIESYFYPL